MNLNIEEFLISLNYLCKKYKINLIASHNNNKTRIRIIEEADDELVDEIVFIEDDKNGNYLK